MRTTAPIVALASALLSASASAQFVQVASYNVGVSNLHGLTPYGSDWISGHALNSDFYRQQGCP